MTLILDKKRLQEPSSFIHAGKLLLLVDCCTVDSVSNTPMWVGWIAIKLDPDNLPMQKMAIYLKLTCHQHRQQFLAEALNMA